MALGDSGARYGGIGERFKGGFDPPPRRGGVRGGETPTVMKPDTRVRPARQGLATPLQGRAISPNQRNLRAELTPQPLLDKEGGRQPVSQQCLMPTERLLSFASSFRLICHPNLKQGQGNNEQHHCHNCREKRKLCRAIYHPIILLELCVVHN